MRTKSTKNVKKALGAAGHELSFQERFAQLVEMLGGAQKAADLLGRGWSTVDNWRQGKTRVPLLDALELAKEAGVSLDWVATGYDRRPDLPPPAGAAGGYEIISRFEPSADGRLAPASGDAGMFAARREWLDALGINAADAALIAAPDDAMAPLVGKSDMVIIDRGVARVSGGGIYVFLRNGAPMLRRAQVMVDGAVQLIPENAAYDRERLAPEQVASLPLAGRARVILRVL